MRIFIICSKLCYTKISSIIEELEKLGHEVSYPNCFNNPEEERAHMGNIIEHRLWKSNMFESSIKHIKTNDVVLVLNLDIAEKGKSYIGGSTMLEMYEAWRQGKEVFVYQDLPECSYKDELNGLVTEIINRDLSKICLK